jgi:hypothetical protein
MAVSSLKNEYDEHGSASAWNTSRLARIASRSFRDQDMRIARMYIVKCRSDTRGASHIYVIFSWVRLFFFYRM